MFTTTIKELLGTKIAKYNEIQPYIIDDEYESSNIVSKKELRNISGK